MTIFELMTQQIHPNKVRQLLFISILILLTYVIVKEMYFLLAAFLGAITLYVLMRNFMFKIILRYKLKRWLAALIMMLLSLIAITIPSFWFVSVAIKKLTPIINDPSIINNTFQTIHTYLLTKFDIDVLNATNLNKIYSQVMPFAQRAIGGTLSTLGNVAVMYFILFFMLTQATSLELWIRKHMPLKNINSDKVIDEFRSLVYSNAVGIPIVALFQGFVGMIGYWIFGVNQFVLMGLLTALCSIIPVVGAMAIYLPIAVYLFATNHTWQGIAVVIWGFGVISTIDNVARFMIQKSISDVHPMVTIFGVIIGINLFGFLGIIFGPLLLSMFTLLVNIYIDEFGGVNSDEMAAESKEE